MSECKALCEAGCSEACNVKASAGAASACEPAGYAPVDRQAGCPNIDSDPAVKNFPSRSHIDQLWHRAMDEAIRMNEFYTRYRFYELVREEVLAEVQR